MNPFKRVTFFPRNEVRKSPRRSRKESRLFNYLAGVSLHDAINYVPTNYGLKRPSRFATAAVSSTLTSLSSLAHARKNSGRRSIFGSAFTMYIFYSRACSNARNSGIIVPVVIVQACYSEWFLRDLSSCEFYTKCCVYFYSFFRKIFRENWNIMGACRISILMEKSKYTSLNKLQCLESPGLYIFLNKKTIRNNKERIWKILLTHFVLLISFNILVYNIGSYFWYFDLSYDILFVVDCFSCNWKNGLLGVVFLFFGKKIKKLIFSINRFCFLIKICLLVYYLYTYFWFKDFFFIIVIILKHHKL